MKCKYETVTALIQDEFRGHCDSDGNLVDGTITQIQLYNPHDSSEVVGWFVDEELAEKVCKLLNSKKKN